MPTTILSVPGLSCDHCRETIHKTLDRVAHGHHTSFDMRHKRISISLDRPIPAEVLMNALADAGYPTYLDESGATLATGEVPGHPSEIYGGAEPRPEGENASPASIYGGPQQTGEPEYASPASIYGGGPPATDLMADAEGEGLSWTDEDESAA